ncbi:hypothetical protein EW146_g4501 [Bondarzewia mesenterica]|uniref:2-(3-amino-3-carboxypropyl)histidine synthase subunit 2 n=1 Tax=Bondarzewia mesenterica TaxID=1095465 RepID=A0A4S4LUF2_9AGAM|nr:hypothetical protein EW146_g4501 [Bondarzewia mesenterica]
MTENVAFSSSGEEVISRSVVFDPAEEQSTETLSPTQFAEYYEIHRTSEEIVSGNFKRIALQFPDELLRDSVPIYRLLKRKIGRLPRNHTVIETDFPVSCCADEVAAQHVDADAIVHFGHATYRLPVIYVFGKKPIDVQDCVRGFVQSLKSSSDLNGHIISLRHDVAYTHQADVIASQLRAALDPLDMSFSYSKTPCRLDPSSSSASASSMREDIPPHNCELEIDKSTSKKPSDSSPIFYIGPSSLRLTNLIMTHSSNPVYSYDPSTRQTHLESVRTNKLLMRRYAVVQKARDADVFGILVGTLGVSSYLPLINNLRQMLKRAHKKSYTISVGKLNPAKLANFMEIECFVLVACPENSLIETKEFYRPIVTPYELQVALQPEPVWTGEYILDFDRLLSISHDKSSSSPNPLSDAGRDHIDQDDPDRPTFSLVTGKYRHAKRYGDLDDTEPQLDTIASPSAVILRNQDNTIATLKDSAAGEFLQSRTFRGLETRVGLDAPSVLEQGRSGIARGYEDDHRPDGGN